MPEGLVYVCRWAKSCQGWTLWVDHQPSLRVGAETYEAAEKLLLARIAEKLGDPAAVLQYAPPLPATATEACFLEPPLVIVRGDSAPARFEPAEKLFSEGVCPSCGAPRGGRTDALLAIGGLWPGYEGGFLGGQFSSIHYFSDRFLSLLTESERSSLTFRPIKTIGRTRKCHYEMTEVGVAGFAGVRGWDAQGWECPACNVRSFHYQEPDVSISRFIDRADLPHNLPTIFPVGSGPGSYLAMRRERWLELIGRREAKGCIGYSLGCVTHDCCDPFPRLRRHWSFLCQRCNEMPWPVLRDRRVWPLPQVIRGTPIDIWLRRAVDAGSVAIARQPLLLDELLRMAESPEGPKPALVYSFRCTECSKLGRIIIRATDVFLDMPFL